MAKSFTHDRYNRVYCHYIKVIFLLTEIMNYRKDSPPESEEIVSHNGKLYKIKEVKFIKLEDGKFNWLVTIG